MKRENKKFISWKGQDDIINTDKIYRYWGDDTVIHIHTIEFDMGDNRLTWEFEDDEAERDKCFAWLQETLAIVGGGDESKPQRPDTRDDLQTRG